MDESRIIFNFLNIRASIALKFYVYFKVQRFRGSESSSSEEDDESDDDMGFGMMDNDSGAESCVFKGFGLTTDSVSKTKQPKDRMTELISLQKSNVIFDISSNDWTESVLDFYAGKYEDVQSSCPSGVAINLWITSIGIKIMEIKMSDKKELWELVAQKARNH